MDHLQFTAREQVQAASIDGTNHWGRRQRFQREFDLVPGRPDLTIVHHTDAFAKHLKRRIVTENSLRSGSKGIEYKFALRRIQQDDGWNSGMGLVKGAQSSQTPFRIVTEVRTNDNGVGHLFVGNPEKLVRAQGRPDNVQSVIAFQGLGQQVAMDATALADQNVNRFLGVKLFGWHVFLQTTVLPMSRLLRRVTTAYLNSEGKISETKAYRLFKFGGEGIREL